MGCAEIKTFHCGNEFANTTPLTPAFMGGPTWIVKVKLPYRASLPVKVVGGVSAIVTVPCTDTPANTPVALSTPKMNSSGAVESEPGFDFSQRVRVPAALLRVSVPLVMGENI